MWYSDLKFYRFSDLLVKFGTPAFFINMWYSDHKFYRYSDLLVKFGTPAFFIKKLIYNQDFIKCYLFFRGLQRRNQNEFMNEEKDPIMTIYVVFFKTIVTFARIYF